MKKLYIFQYAPQRRFNVHTTSPQRYGCCIDVETTLCAYRNNLISLFNYNLFQGYSTNFFTARRRTLSWRASSKGRIGFVSLTSSSNGSSTIRNSCWGNTLYSFLSLSTCCSQNPRPSNCNTPMLRTRFDLLFHCLTLTLFRELLFDCIYAILTFLSLLTVFKFSLDYTRGSAQTALCW